MQNKVNSNKTVFDNALKDNYKLRIINYEFKDSNILFFYS